MDDQSARAAPSRLIGLRAALILHLMRRTRVYRLGLVFTAIFQLLFPTFASVADARAEAMSERSAHAHVEARSSDQCVPVHAADCAICRVIASAATAGEAPVVLLPTVLVVSPSLPRHERVSPLDVAQRRPSQRAPPTA